MRVLIALVLVLIGCDQSPIQIGTFGSNVRDGGAEAGDGGAEVSDGGSEVNGQLLTTGPQGPMHLVADQNNLYWTTQGTGNPYNLMTVPKAGGTAISLLTIENDMTYLALDDEYVYASHFPGPVVTLGMGSIIRVPKAGGAAETIVADLNTPGAMAVDDTFVYWADGSTTGTGISRASKTGGAPAFLAAVDGPSQMVIDGGYLYCTDSQRGLVTKISTMDGSSSVLASVGIGTGGIAFDVTNVYFTACQTSSCLSSDLYSVPKAGGAPQLLVEAPGYFGWDIAVGPNSVFLPISTLGGSGGAIGSVLKTGGTLSTVVSATKDPITLVIDSDESHLYWADHDTGNIYKVELR